jgi:hypothetical protein
MIRLARNPASAVALAFLYLLTTSGSAIGSIVAGNTITLVAGQYIGIQGSTISAAGDLHIQTAKSKYL